MSSNEGGARRQLGQSAVLVAATGATAALTFLFMMAAGKTLGPAGAADLYAGMFLLFAVHTLFSPVATAVARQVAVHNAEGAAGAGRAVTDQVSRISGRIALGVGAVAIATTPWQAQWLAMDPGVLAAAWLAALLIGVATVLRGAMRGVQAFAALGGNMVAEAGLRVVLGVGALLTVGRADIAMAAYIVGVLAVWPHLLAWRNRRLPAEHEGKSPSTWSRFVAPLLLLAIADAGFQNYDVLFVKRALSADHAGAYGAAATLSRALGVLVTPFVIQVVPLLADLAARRQTPNRVLARLVSSYLLLSVGALLVLSVGGGGLLTLLFGSGFDAASGVLVPHALGALAGYLAMVLAQGLAAVGRLRIAGLYLLGFVAEVVVLPLVGDTMEGVAIALLVVKVLVLVATTIAWLLYKPDLRPESANEQEAAR